MTRASKEARAVERRRRQVARLIGYAGAWCVTPGGIATPKTSDRLAARDTVFDVHVAREYGERLVALEAEQVVFEDWCRERGGGPEVFDHVLLSDNPWLDMDLGRGGGWPGPLAREYGWRECEACEGRGEWREKMQPFCVRCKGRGRVRRPGIPPGFANGRSLARLGRRLLAALEGQPSECQACGGVGRRALRVGPWQPAVGNTVRECPNCRGTGHNLSGVLPPVDYDASTVRGAADAFVAARNAGRSEVDAWIVDVLESRLESLGDAHNMRTRVVPRGEHDVDPSSLINRTVWRRRRLGHEDGEWLDADEHVRAWRHVNTLPRWRRGELLHADRQRRFRPRGLDYSDLGDLVERARVRPTAVHVEFAVNDQATPALERAMRDVERLADGTPATSPGLDEP